MFKALACVTVPVVVGKLWAVYHFLLGRATFSYGLRGM